MRTGQTSSTVTFLFEWLIIALIAGITGVGLVQIFQFLLKSLQIWVDNQFLPLPFFTALGAAVVTGIIYRISPDSAGEGIPGYISIMQTKSDRLNIKTTVYKFLAALITIGTFGSGGITGPLGRVSAGIMNWLTEKLFHNREKDVLIRLGTICGMAAVVGTIFHAPIGAGIFAVEILSKDRLKYHELYPAIMASSAAVLICKAFHIPSYYLFETVNEFMDPVVVIPVLFVSFLGGFMGSAFNGTYRFVSTRMKRHEIGWQQFVRSVTLSFLIAGIAWILYPDLLGTSTQLVRHIFLEPEKLYLSYGKNIPLFFVCLGIIFFKGIGNILTVGTGLSAGFTGPIAILGMMIGLFIADILNIPVHSANYYALIAAGFSSMMASTMNIPLAAAIITLELFGLQYSFSAAVSAVIGFQLSRNSTLYEYKPVSEK